MLCRELNRKNTFKKEINYLDSVLQERNRLLIEVKKKVFCAYSTKNNQMKKQNRHLKL